MGDLIRGRVMTVADLIRDTLPRLKEFFPEQVEQEWPMEDYLRGEKQRRARVLAGLDAWRAESKI
jgi:hypothetical protein